ncbi:TetR/AcrR family transcriptional regulator [Streptomyces sp. SL13]|jgi:AcrR family transcriptional regulator|uniref:TetR/AcrR family transcriptional regulator n=1 Tax=Streptantibioticus silvisoli TaxID=2705255 RepID=A0AA90K877_9ACTN|nr:TetR/AcrR family transcriptional regulator [Streptantibioticus silvisoli]MDI5962514.1 TetR/AcrR family transcriptional regulator [Streptantibioticus silvisoli]MDI5969147.1 TetR/AcrR family transcriptional regulator [Streptantibioticus silvisoli]
MPPQRSKTVEALLAGAERAFVERGFHGASIGYICQCAGRTTGAFYSNYDSKLQLFLAVFRRQSDRTVERVEQGLAAVDTGRDPAPQLARLFTEIADRALDDRWLFLNIEFRLMAIRDKEAAAALTEHEEQFNRRVGTPLEALLRRSGRPPALSGEELAAFLGATIRGIRLDRGFRANTGGRDPLPFATMERALEGLFTARE